MDKTNPKKLKPKGKKLIKILKSIIREKPFTKFIKNTKTVEKRNLQQKITVEKYFQNRRDIHES